LLFRILQGVYVIDIQWTAAVTGCAGGCRLFMGDTIAGFWVLAEDKRCATTHKHTA
jgi:hypothetical protein